MRCRQFWWHVTVIGSFAAGCSKPAAPPPAPAKAPVASAPAQAPAPPATPAASAKSVAKTEGAERPPIRLAHRPEPGPAKAGAARKAPVGALGAAKSAAADALKTMNPFRPPRLDVPAVKPIEKGEENKAVRLVGFVDVGELKAILSFDGKLQTLSVGDVYNNVSIVEVRPPTVKLRQGPREWEAGLFQQPIINTTGSSTANSTSSPQVTIGSSSEPTRAPATFQDLFPADTTKTNPFASPGRLETLTPGTPQQPLQPNTPPGAPLLPGSSEFVPQPVAPPAPPAIPTLAPKVNSSAK